MRTEWREEICDDCGSDRERLESVLFPSRVMTLPTLDVAMTVELGRRVVLELMTEADWHGVLDRMAHWIDIDAELPEMCHLDPREDAR